MSTKYALGIDFGTRSARVLIVETDGGREVVDIAMDYAHGVMDSSLPDGTPLEADWALQHPGDYVDVLRTAIQKALATGGISPADIVGVGIDFTSCTMLPLDEAGMPLCLRAEYASTPHAYVKLWKHHAAQAEADKINRIAGLRGEDLLDSCGGRVSSEAMIPKVWQVLNEAPEVYRAAYKFIEAGDWIVMLLTGEERRSKCMAGFKSLWTPSGHSPDPAFFRELDPRLENVVAEKLGSLYHPIGARAGRITAEAAELTGLEPGTAVSVACIDAHASLLGAGISEPGQMVLIMGTSSCHILLDEERRHVPGICGMVSDGIVPGLVAYEAGQCCVGDHFEWFVENCVPASYQAEAARAGVDMHGLLSERCAQLRPGESGVIALDWWNGNRSVLADADLAGAFIGCTLQTKPEHLYLALVEATAFGTKLIVENYRQHGVAVREIRAAGGIASKNSMVMQVYADVLDAELAVCGTSQASALGAAMLGAAAAGAGAGGHDSLVDAVRAMSGACSKRYVPDKERVGVYQQLYEVYCVLHDYFGRAGEGKHLLRQLKAVKGRHLTAIGRSSSSRGE